MHIGRETPQKEDFNRTTHLRSTSYMDGWMDANAGCCCRLVWERQRHLMQRRLTPSGADGDVCMRSVCPWKLGGLRARCVSISPAEYSGRGRSSGCSRLQYEDSADSTQSVFFSFGELQAQQAGAGFHFAAVVLTCSYSLARDPLLHHDYGSSCSFPGMAISF
jgi:hypothetical protein